MSISTLRRKTKNQLIEEIEQLKMRVGELEADDSRLVDDPRTVKFSSGTAGENSEQFQQLVRTAPVPILLIDRAGQILLVNLHVEEMFGYDRGELVGKQVESLFPDRLRKEHKQYRRKFFSSPDTQPVTKGRELAGLRKDGTEFPIEVSLGYAEARDGALALEFIADVTERKRAEDVRREDEQRLKVALSTIDLAVFNQDLNLRYTWMYQPQMGYAIAEVVGRTDAELLPGDAAEVITRIKRQVIERNERARNEVRIEHNGEVHFFDLVVEPLADTSGKPAGITGASLDITERKQVEQRLSESEERLRQAVRAGNIGIFDHDQINDIIYWSPEQRGIYGWGPDEPVTLERYFKQVHPDDRERIIQAVQRAHDPAGDGSFDVEHRIIDRSGAVHWLTTRSRTFFEGKGSARRPVRTIGAVSDITELKQQEEALRDNEERLRLSVRVGNIGIFDHDHRTNTAYWSPEHRAIYGWGPDEPVPVDAARDQTHPDDFKRIDEAVKHAWDPVGDGAFNVDYRIIDRTGATHWILIRSRTFFEGEGSARHSVRTLGAVMDITERKLVEERVRKLNRVYSVSSNINQAIVRIRELHEVYEKACQVAVEDGGFRMAWIGLINPETKQMSVAAHAGVADGYPDMLAALFNNEPSLYSPAPNAIRTRKPVICNDVRSDPSMARTRAEALQRGYGSLVVLPVIVSGEVRGVFNLYANGAGYFDDDEIRLLTELAQDISFAMEFAEREERRQRAEEAIRKLNTELEQKVAERTSQLRQSKERVEAILDNSPDAILLLGADGLIGTGNPTFSRWFGYDQDEVHGYSLADLSTPESAPDLERTLKAVVENLETRRLEIVARRKDGTTFDVTMALAPVTEAMRLVGVVCSLQDISKLKEVERLKDAFVSNVSHELRTPITSIKLNQELIRTNTAQTPIYLDRMEREVNRLNDLIEALLRLSRLDQRRTELEFGPVNLNDLVDKHVEDRSLIAESRSLRLMAQKQDDLPVVQADGGLLGQALSVLLTNALNYTPPGGEITVRTLTAQRDRQTWAGFVVSDTGPGIPPAELPHLFERFFRGKTGRGSGMPGTGLGLAIAHEIVSLHNGRIEVGSGDPSGAGAVFSVWLPLKESAG